MIEALIGGQRDPAVLAGLAREVTRRKIPELEMACDGRFTAAHGQMCRPWTYVGGPAELVACILDAEGIEALPAEPGDWLTHIEEWVTRWVDNATAVLLSDGAAVISTSRGTVRASFDRPSRLHAGKLRTSFVGDNGVIGSAEVGFSNDDAADLREEVSFYLAQGVLGLIR
jgi:hypothetical protein